MALDGLYKDPIPHLVWWAVEHSEIRVVMLTSTRAVPNAPLDLLSDYDVILVVQDLHAFVDDRGWLEEFGEVLVVYWDPVSPNPVYAIDQCANVTQYTDGLRIDFTLWPVPLFEKIVMTPGLPDELDAGYRILLDKDQLTAGMGVPSFSAYIPQRPTDLEFQTLINDFLTDPPYVAKCLWRGELLPAKWCLDYDMKLVYLKKLLEWRMEIDHGWRIPAWWLGKGLKKRLPPDLWTEVEHTFAGADPEANWEALERTMTLFRRVALEVGAHLGYAYPEELHQRVWAHVEAVKRLDAPPA